MMFGIEFLSNFGRNIIVHFLECITYKKYAFNMFLGFLKKCNFLLVTLLGKWTIIFLSKLDKKMYIKHHQIDQKISKFCCFCSFSLSKLGKMLIPNNRPKNIENYTFSGRDDDALKILFFEFSDIIVHWINWIFTEAFNFRIFPKDTNVDTSHPVLFEMPIKLKN